MLSRRHSSPQVKMNPSLRKSTSSQLVSMEGGGGQQFCPNQLVTRVFISVRFQTYPPSFQCQSETQRVPYSLVCDHRQDCLDGSDETFCTFLPCYLHYQFQRLNKQVCLVLRPTSICLIQSSKHVFSNVPFHFY